MSKSTDPRRVPTNIDGTPVETLDNPFSYDGERWVTLIPEEEGDEQMWEFSLSTGRLIKTA